MHRVIIIISVVLMLIFDAFFIPTPHALAASSNCSARGAYVDLSGCNLSNANLSNANLSNANLSNAKLYGTNLTDANFTGANLTGADLSYTTLTNANLTGATLTGVTSGQIFGTPTLPSDWELISGYLIMVLISPEPISPMPSSPVSISPEPISPMPSSPVSDLAELLVLHVHFRLRGN
jgi:hypothetical protein